MPHRILQQTGITGALGQIRDFMTNPDTVAVSFSGSALAVFFSAIVSGMQGYVFTSMWVMWLGWMLLGIIAALHKGEKIEMHKVWQGALHFLAALVLWFLAVNLDEANAGNPIASTAFGGFMSTVFLLKAIKKGTYFFPGLRDLAERVVPGLVEEKNPDPPPRSPSEA